MYVFVRVLKAPYDRRGLAGSVVRITVDLALFRSIVNNAAEFTGKRPILNVKDCKNDAAAQRFMKIGFI